METLTLSGPCVNQALALDTSTLADLPDEQQVPDVGAVAAGRQGWAVRLAGLAERAGVQGARFGG